MKFTFATKTSLLMVSRNTSGTVELFKSQVTKQEDWKYKEKKTLNSLSFLITVENKSIRH